MNDKQEIEIMNLINTMYGSLDTIRDGVLNGSLSVSFDDLVLCDFSLREISNEIQYEDYISFSEDDEISINDLDESMYFIRGMD